MITQAQIDVGIEQVRAFNYDIWEASTIEELAKFVSEVYRTMREVGEMKLADGCCSAIKPCNYQKLNPSGICDVCLAAAAPKLIGLNQLETEMMAEIKLLRAANKRLAAAAEAGLKRHTISGSDAADDDDMPAATEVGETLEPMEWHRRKAVAATIERCAQVAGMFERDSMVAFRIAAAIRALKDKP